jgi:hypothetical protein
MSNKRTDYQFMNEIRLILKNHQLNEYLLFFISKHK